jgi:glycosyltransferase involved in cell wall biosynthesis
MKVSFHQILVSQELGGAGLTALRLAKFLSGRTGGAHVWIPGDGPARTAAENWGLVQHVYDSAGSLSSQRLRAAVANLKIGYRLRCVGPGIAHIHGPYHYGALRLALKLAGLKSVVHVQLEEIGNGLCWAFEHPPEVIVTCARFLVEHVRRSLPEPYQARQRIVAVPNAVDTKLFCPGDKREAKLRIGAPIDVPLLVMLANLAPHKGQETAIRCVAELKERGVDVVCWLAGVERTGGTTYSDYLYGLVDELRVSEQIRLLGFRDDTVDLLRAADFFLLPSTREGLPLSILEAQASKVPVLAAPTPGICEVIADDETGFLIPQDDPVGYANRIQALLRNPALYYRLAEKAHEKVVREYDWIGFCERIWAIYRELLPVGVLHVRRRNGQTQKANHEPLKTGETLAGHN